MNARQKKLYLIQQKLRQSRKANQQAVVAEKRREVRLSAVNPNQPCFQSQHEPDQRCAFALSTILL